MRRLTECEILARLSTELVRVSRLRQAKLERVLLFGAVANLAVALVAVLVDLPDCALFLTGSAAGELMALWAVRVRRSRS